MQAIKTVMERNQETFEGKVADPCWVAILVKETYGSVCG